MRSAVLAAGTNSCRLLVAQDDSGIWRPSYHEIRGTRLGEGLAKTGCLSPPAMDRTLAALEALWAVGRGADRMFCIGTNALRTAANAGEFASRFQRAIGLPLEILSGQEEGSSSYAGAATAMKIAGIEITRGLCVADIGGGSTEIAVGRGDFEPDRVKSIAIGAVSLSETSFASDPPTAAELSRASAEVDLALDHARSFVGQNTGAELVVVGGTADAAARMLIAYPTDTDDGVAALGRQDLAALLKLVSSVPVAARRQLRGLPEQRADIFPAGLVIFIELMSALEFDRAHVTQSDLLLGYIARHAG